MKLTKTQLTEMVREAVEGQLNEMTDVDSRMAQLERFKRGNDLTTYELLEDVLEQLDSNMWKMILIGLKEKYGFLL